MSSAFVEQLSRTVSNLKRIEWFELSVNNARFGIKLCNIGGQILPPAMALQTHFSDIQVSHLTN